MAAEGINTCGAVSAPPPAASGARGSEFKPVPPTPGCGHGHFPAIVGFSKLKGKRAGLGRKSWLHPRRDSGQGPTAASPCPGGLSQSMQILRASATLKREPWQGKRLSAATALAMVGCGGDPEVGCRQQRAGVRLFSGGFEASTLIQPLNKSAKEPSRAASRMRTSKGGCAFAHHSQVGTDHPVLHPAPHQGTRFLLLDVSKLLPGTRYPAAEKRWGEKVGLHRQENPNFVLVLGSHPPPRASPPRGPACRFIFSGRLATNLSFICHLSYQQQYRGPGWKLLSPPGAGGPTPVSVEGDLRRGHLKGEGKGGWTTFNLEHSQGGRGGTFSSPR